MDLVQYFLDKKIFVIVRGTYGKDLENLAKALYKGGVRLMEVTFDQKDPDCIKKTTEAISLLCSLFTKGDFFVGAGTVLTKEQLKAAHKAGAQFIISPNTNTKIIKMAKRRGLVSIPGAMTPSEIMTAREAGGDIIKFFPAATMGMKYLKDILAPINHVPIMATAGITEENFKEFLKLGLKGAGISGRLTDKELIKNKDWDEFTKRAKAFVKIAQDK